MVENRRNQWLAMGAFSTIGLCALLNDIDGDLGDEDDDVIWSASSLIIGLGIAGLAFLAHAVGKLFVGTFIEGLSALAVFGVLAGGISTIMNPDNEIAQNAGGAIANANLYFFSWGALICAFQVCMMYLRDVHGIGKPASTKDFSALGWGGFAAASFVVMAAATRLYKATNCDDSSDVDFKDDFCDRTTLAFLLGAIGGFLALIWLGVGTFLPAIVDTLMAFLMLAVWCVGVAKITFGDAAPAKELGNLYFSSWASFIMATKLAGDGAGKLFGTITGDDQPVEEPVEETPPEEPPKDNEKDEEKSGDEEAGDSA